MTGRSAAEVHAQLTAPGEMFEIGEETVGGLPMRVWKQAPRTLGDIVALSRSHGDKTFLVYEDDRVSFEEHFAAVAALSKALIERYGVSKGDRVAIAARNLPEWPVAFFAAAVAGAVAVPLNAWWTGSELEYGLSDSGAKVLIADQERVERLSPVLGELGLAATVVIRGEPDRAGGQVSYDELVGGASGGALPDVDLGPEDDATIFYTSGTTGRPKGALGSHRNICTSVMGLGYSVVASMLRAGGEPPDMTAIAADRPQEATLLSVPFFHVTGCHAVLLGNLVFGGKLVMMHKWDPERALELIERERITSFGGVPSMVWQVLECPDLAKRDISSVKSIGYGGAPAPPELVRRIEEMFPGRIPSNGFGMTETSAGVTANAGEDYLRKPDSVGPPTPVCDVRVVDQSGDALGVGQLGELQVRGPNVVKGYWRQPDATAEVFTSDGWLRTGDIARIDEEGFVYIVDRAKDMVIRGGENVYCAEVEAALFEHQAVGDAAVFGVPHPVLGEEVGAAVVLREGKSATREELLDHMRQRVAGFKVPVKIWFQNQPLPRSPAGKVLKRELRDELIGEEPSNR